MDMLYAKERQSLHLGHYNDAREAAYVCAKFNVAVSSKDYATVQHILDHTRNHDGWDQFPEDLYTIPAALMSAQDAALAHAEYKAGKQKVKKGVVKDRNQIAQGHMFDHFTGVEVKALARAMGGAQAFQAYLAGVTIQQVADEHGLTLI
jgi:hypothetical protein